MLAADEKLFIVTAEGSILAFAAPAAGDATKHVAAEAPPPPADEWTETSRGHPGTPRAFATATPWCWGSTAAVWSKNLCGSRPCT